MRKYWKDKLWQAIDSYKKLWSGRLDLNQRPLAPL